ncbi:MAG: hypothetical protein F4X59_08810 [Holophagales bacterium]|nr:hypothetical protein [Holophagales bacterium]
MRHPFPISILALPMVLAASGVGAANTAGQEETDGLAGVYSFVGALDGDATLFAARSGAQSELELHLPILRGDRIWTTPNARLAVLMSDRSILAVDYDSEVTLERIAGSPDGEDQDSLYVLHRGRLSLEVEDHLLESELPVVDTANARIYVKQDGRYQIHSDGSRWTEVTVLAGFAEVVTQRGSVIVRGGETLVANGLDNPWIELQNGAGVAATALDDWTAGHRASLVAYAAVDAGGYRDALGAHGEWVEVDDRRAWKPYVESNWQPYSRGRWTDTPAGLYWVARDPWGPLTYHYGSWNRHPAWGWLWYPGLVYAPSHVYWYWGPSYVGWIPRGYYQHYYRGLGYGLRFGLYGWAGGYWDPFNTWIFCPTGYLGYGRGYTYGHSLRRRHPRLERGIITTDTRGIDRRNWRDPAAAQRILINRRDGLDESEIPNADNFVARRPDLDPSFRGEIRRSDGDPAVASVRRVRPSANGSGLTSVTAGGVRAAPSTRPARASVVREDGADIGIRRSAPVSVTRDNEPARPGVSVRKAAPASPGATPAPSRRPTAGRRVLDAIRSRDAGSSPTRVRSTPRSSTPRTAPPTRVRSTPRGSTPEAAPPTRVRSTPRSSTPRAAPPTRVRSTPRSSTPKAAPPTRVRSTPRASTPRSSSRPTRVRSTPRSSAPRSSSPPRSYSPPSSSPSSYSPPSSTPSSSSPPPSSARRGGRGRAPPPATSPPQESPGPFKGARG